MFWNRFKSKKKYKCSKCGKVHDELPALAFNTPDYYEFLNETDKMNIAEISDDFCIIRHPEQTDYFIRTKMTFQIIDSCDDLDYGLWVSVSEKTFEEYKAEFKNNVEGKTYFGRICNRIPDYDDTLGLHVNVVTRANEFRPDIIPHQSEHRLVKDWENGITIIEANKRIEKMTNKVG